MLNIASKFWQAEGYIFLSMCAKNQGKTPRIAQKMTHYKGLNQIKLTWEYFVKNSLLIHYFLVTLRFFLLDFSVSKNIPCKAFYSEKNGFGTTLKRCEIHSIIAKNLHFSYFWNPSCVCKNVLAYACFGPRTRAEGHFGNLISKIDFYSF